MKHNLIPALIIAAAIIIAGVSLKPASPVKTFLADLETAAQTKDADGKTSLNRILEGFAASASSSIQAGFDSGQNEKAKTNLAVIEKLQVTDVKIVAGSQKTQERVIGIVRNNSDQTISGVNFNTIYRDADGQLIDVGASFSQLKGTLKPGAELGFEIRRDLGSFKEEDEVLAARKAAQAEVAVVDLRIVD